MSSTTSPASTYRRPLEAALVRLLLVTVVLRLLGDSAWRLPAVLRRVLPDIRFGHS